MNNLQFKGKANQIKGDLKIWFGKTTSDLGTIIEGGQDKVVGYLQEQHGITKESAEKELSKFNDARAHFVEQTEDFKKEALKKWDKLTHHDLEEAKESYESFTKKMKDKYDHTQEEAEKQFKEFMSKFHS